MFLDRLRSPQERIVPQRLKPATAVLFMARLKPSPSRIEFSRRLIWLRQSKGAASLRASAAGGKSFLDSPAISEERTVPQRKPGTPVLFMAQSKTVFLAVPRTVGEGRDGTALHPRSFPATSAYPTLRRMREGWATRSLGAGQERFASTFRSPWFSSPSRHQVFKQTQGSPWFLRCGVLPSSWFT